MKILTTIFAAAMSMVAMAQTGVPRPEYPRP